MITTTQLNAFGFQFITHCNDKVSYFDSARLALEGGCKWIQLRMKDALASEVEEMAKRILPLCRTHEAVFIIDDHVDVCRNVHADGVHLGKNDMKPEEARSILGDKFIIGATCNTYDDILAVSSVADYVGCGPFRYTTTKKNLAPVLGLDGYRDIIWKTRSNGINIPIVAIGGIVFDDIADVLDAGPNGVALSGAVINAENPADEAYRISRLINNRNKL